MSGSIDHILPQSTFAEVDESVTLHEMRIPGSDNYVFTFPITVPSTTGLSLVVDSISSNTVSTSWSAPTTQNAGLNSNNSNHILLEAPSVLTNSYSLQFPDYATSLTGKVLAVQSQNTTTREIVLEFKDFSSVLDVRMTHAATGKFVRLNAHPTLTDTYSISLNSDFISGRDALQNKVIYVESDNGAGSLVLGMSDPYDLYPIAFNKLNFVVQPAQTENATILFPRHINVTDASTIQGQLLGVTSQTG